MSGMTLECPIQSIRVLEPTFDWKLCIVAYNVCQRTTRTYRAAARDPGLADSPHSAAGADARPIAKAIEFNSEDVLQVEQGSLYPALHRLIKRRWISVEQGTSENNRRVYLAN